MTPELPQAAGQEPKGMGEAARISGVLFEPGKAFEDIAKRPKWLIPWLLLVLLGPFGLVFDYALDKRVGFARLVDQQMESRMAQMSPDQRANAERGIEIQKKYSYIFYYAYSLVGVMVIGLMVAGVLWVIGSILSAGVTYKQTLAVWFYSGVPSIIWALLAIVVMFLKSPDDFNLRNPLAFNAAAFLDPLTTSKFLYAIATALDLFAFWRIFLVAVGLKAAAGKKLSMGGAVFAVALPWAIVSLIGAALAGAFG